MEKRVYFLKFNKKILVIDLLSFTFGAIGTILGLLSILALKPFWNDKNASINITIIAIIFDTFSFCFAFSAFFLMYRLVKSKKEMIKQNQNLYKKDLTSISCDFSSFLIGLVGTIFEVTSVIVLLPKWNNELFSYQITIAAVVLDFASTFIAFIATMLTINILKGYRERGNSIFELNE